MEVKKAIIPIAGLGTRFLPLSLILSKEFVPLADKPAIQYIAEEAKNSGITEIIFVVSPKQKNILKYFGKQAELEKLLIKRKKDKILKELQDFEKMFEGVSFSIVVQSSPLGDGHAILQAGKHIKDEAVCMSFNDDIFYSETPAMLQLKNIFQTTNVPIMGLKTVSNEKLPSYGVVDVEKIAHNLYKIKKIIEKPAIDKAPSNLVHAGRDILTPEVFEYLKKAKPSEKGEIILAEVFDKMLEDGKTIYGYEIKGEWLECGDKLKWLKSFFYMALKDSRYREELKTYLKSLK